MTPRIHWAASVAVVASAIAGACLGCSSGEDAPSGSSAPPAAASSSPPTAPQPIDGLYLQFIDGPNSTYNGVPRYAGPPKTQWWAFRSACTERGCFATSTKLNDYNTNVAEMPVTQRVYRFVDGAWEWPHDEALECQKADESPAPGSTQAHYVTRLVPQSDGTLSGKSTITALDDGCGDKGAVVETPTTYTRKGEVPPDVPMMDPTKVG